MSADKPFEATPSRIARAKREGDVARSGDAVAVSSFAATGLAVFVVMAPIGAAFRIALADAGVGTLAAGPFAVVASCVLAVLLSAIAAAVLATYAQTRTFTLRFPTLKFEKLNPAAGLKRMFGRDAVVSAAKATAVSLAVGCALVPIVRDAFIAELGTSLPLALSERTRSAVAATLATAIAIGGAFAVGDVVVERGKWLRRLRMSFEEVRRDHRQSEGDPQLRNRRRQSHRALLRGSVARVRDAAFVVTNPNHIAIALAYDPPAIAVPCVLVRAADEAAALVRAEARRRGIPIVENVALARALYEHTDVDDVIPRDAYIAVAKIVAAVAAARRREAS